MAVAGVAALTATFKLLNAHINAATVALAFLLVVLFVATWWGARPAVVASVLSLLCFNFFFLPPFGTLTVEAPDNWIALLSAISASNRHHAVWAWQWLEVCLAVSTQIVRLGGPPYPEQLVSSSALVLWRIMKPAGTR